MHGPVIHNITHRVVAAHICDWLELRVEKTLKTGEHAAWYKTARKAVKYLREYPVKCERLGGEGTYAVAIPSQSNPDEEYYATPYECDCRGNRTTGRCYHRMVARLLESVDRYEAREAAAASTLYKAEQARRRLVTLTSPIGERRVAAYYDGVFVGLADDEDSANTLIERYRESLAWVADAAA